MADCGARPNLFTLAGAVSDLRMFLHRNGVGLGSVSKVRAVTPSTLRTPAAMDSPESESEGLQVEFAQEKEVEILRALATATEERKALEQRLQAVQSATTQILELLTGAAAVEAIGPIQSSHIPRRASKLGSAFAPLRGRRPSPLRGRRGTDPAAAASVPPTSSAGTPPCHCSGGRRAPELMASLSAASTMSLPLRHGPCEGDGRGGGGGRGGGRGEGGSGGGGGGGGGDGGGVVQRGCWAERG